MDGVAAHRTPVLAFSRCGTLTSVSASFAFTLPFLQGGNPYGWVFYFLPGLVVDFAFRYLPHSADKFWFLILLGASIVLGIRRYSK
jgi:hypothetical protein